MSIDSEWDLGYGGQCQYWGSSRWCDRVLKDVVHQTSFMLLSSCVQRHSTYRCKNVLIWISCAPRWTAGLVAKRAVGLQFFFPSCAQRTAEKCSPRGQPSGSPRQGPGRAPPRLASPRLPRPGRGSGGSAGRARAAGSCPYPGSPPRRRHRQNGGAELRAPWRRRRAVAEGTSGRGGQRGGPRRSSPRGRGRGAAAAALSPQVGRWRREREAEAWLRCGDGRELSAGECEPGPDPAAPRVRSAALSPRSPGGGGATDALPSAWACRRRERPGSVRPWEEPRPAAGDNGAGWERRVPVHPEPRSLPRRVRPSAPCFPPPLEALGAGSASFGRQLGGCKCWKELLPLLSLNRAPANLSWWLPNSCVGLLWFS